MEQAALSGLTVIELAEGVSAPYCARLLGALGAEVIKIEKAPNGDGARRVGPFVSANNDPEMSGLFLYLNTNKKSVTLDWESAQGKRILEQLLGRADILVENVLGNGYHDLDFDRLREANPQLIHVSLSDFGSSGPYKDWQASPLVNLALGGYLYLSGEENREPLALPGYQADYLAGLHGYIGCMLALWSRDFTGKGQRVEIATMETLAALHQFSTVMYTYGDTIRRRHGNRWEVGNYARYPITALPCKDGFVSFAVSTERQWEMMCSMIDRPDMLEDPRFPTFHDRRTNADAIDEILIDWLKDKTKQEVFQQAAGVWSVPVAPVSGLSEVLSDPQYRAREFWAELDHPVAGSLEYPTLPFKMSETPPNFERAPLLGEHNREVYGSLLGFDGRELERLGDEGVI